MHRRALRRILGPVRPPRDREWGQVTVVLVVLAAVLVMLGGLAYDGARILDAKRAASSLALEAARASAQAISTESIYQRDGNITVDPIQARIAAAEFLDQHDEWSISVRGDTVSVTVWLTQPLHVLSMLGIESRRVTGHASARAIQGIGRGDYQ